MTMQQDEQRFRELAQRIDPGSVLRRTWPLAGGVSAQVTVMELERPDGQTTRLTVRRHGETDLRHNPHIARDEFRLLEIARAHCLAVPEPCLFDESCELFPSPFIVIAYIEGTTDVAPHESDDYVEQIAAELVRIHQVPALPELSFLPEQGKGFGDRPERLDHSLDEGRIRVALEATWPLPSMNASVLLHGDYWPGNIIRHQGELVAVVDWEDARTGDPLSDLGNTRLELLWAFDRDVMYDFTERYRFKTHVDCQHLPYWDLCAALRPCSKLSQWGLDATTEQRMREQHAWFVSEALKALSA
jgi:aminoglycoside phosphotransferase (APT) family kinase protein